jgi:signal transduction histidine kinase
MAARTEEWKAFGGSWELTNGSMRNDSDERGAKLLMGSPFWQNYSVEADVMLLGTGGDAGLIIRSSDEEEGVDAYTGYYAGLRDLDNSMVLGRAGHGWTEITAPFTADNGKVLPSKWYHLKIMAYGCQIVAMVSLPLRARNQSITVNDVDCILSGRAGLRSYASGGMWRNVVVLPATQADVAQALAESEPKNNEQHNQTADAAMTNTFHAPWADYRRPPALPSDPNAQPISSLSLIPLASAKEVTVRGIVILTWPSIFVQDSTGGIAIAPSAHEMVKVGDEVEATGTVRPGSFSATLENATMRVLWGGTPTPALSVTASQAATGAFDATFIEVEGWLRHKRYGPDDTLILDFDSGPQSFRAVMKSGRGNYLYDKLKPGSLVRVRGVSVVDAAYTREITPFALLVRSTDDVIVLAGPPWWSAGHLVAVAIAFLLMALLTNFIYHRVENWRLRAIAEERERLAFEMHDTLAQGFAGIGFQLEAIRTEVPEGCKQMHQQLDLATELVRHSHAEARRTVDMLRPQQLESEGLLRALTACAHRMVEGGYVQVVSESVGEPRLLPLRISDTLYRIGQEALANAVRHAHPGTLNVILEYRKNQVTLRIKDDGSGFVQAEDLRGFGLLGMRKRAAAISSKLEVLSEPGKGTEISVVSSLPQRITITSWPTLLWRFLKEHAPKAPIDTRPHSHSYRG